MPAPIKPEAGLDAFPVIDELHAATEIAPSSTGSAPDGQDKEQVIQRSAAKRSSTAKLGVDGSCSLASEVHCLMVTASRTHSVVFV